MSGMWCTALATLSLLIGFVESISPVEVKGAKLFTAEDGNQFFVKGVAYQRAGSTMVIDPLVDTSQCELDAGLMTAIGVNTVRVYTTDPTGDHDGCMQAFASQGIYVWIDLASPTYSIDRADPNYTLDLFDRFTSVMDAFSQYNNTLSFTAANELINDEDTVSTAPYIKAIVRDLKAFRDARGYRRIPISYSSADVSDLQLPTKDYLTCGSQNDTIEMFGMNVYSWCGDSSYTQSGYDRVYTQFQDTNIPALFSEVGCILTGPRTFGEVAAILGSVFPATFSGVIVYEWPQQASDYGLVEYPKSDGTGFPSTRQDYNNLGSIYTTASPVSTAMIDYTPTNSPPACPSSSSDWTLSGSESLPTIQALNIDTVTARTTYYSGSETAAAAVASATGTQTDSVSSASETSSSKAQNSLSTGAIAGIAVGGAVVGMAFALVVFFLLRRRRNTKRAEGGGMMGLHSGRNSREADGFNKAELPASSTNGLMGKQELQSNDVHEAEGAPKLYEMESAGRQHVYEMPGSGTKPTELEGTDVAREMK